MNRHNALQYIPLIQALAAGKTIQFRPTLTSRWIDLNPNNSFGFSVEPEHYRIKPDPPMVKYIVIDKRDGLCYTGTIFNTPSAAHKHIEASKACRLAAAEYMKVVKFVEVQDEETQQ